MSCSVARTNSDSDMLTATMDERRRATAADKIAYLIILVCVGVVWLFGALPYIVLAGWVTGVVMVRTGS